MKLPFSELDHLDSAGYEVTVNDHKYAGEIAVGDTLVVNGVTYAVLGINEDAIVVKDLNV
jgi:hypothetical protein